MTAEGRGIHSSLFLSLHGALTLLFKRIPSEKFTTELSPFIRHATLFLAILLLAHLTVMLEQILPLAALHECFWEASCPEGKVDTKALEDWQNNFRAQLVREEDGCDKTEDCRFSFQWDMSLEKLLWSLIKINPVHTSALCFEQSTSTETGRKRKRCFGLYHSSGLYPCLGTATRPAVGLCWQSRCWIIAIWEGVSQQSYADANITRWLRPTCTPSPAPFNKMQNSAIEEHWHHSSVSNHSSQPCFPTAVRLWLWNGYRQCQQHQLAVEFLLLFSQFSLLSILEAHLIHHLSSLHPFSSLVTDSSSS